MTELRSWDEVKARWAAEDARHAARPWPLRRTIDAYRWCRLMRSHLLHPKPWRRVQWRIQRARRGWSERDVWNLHYYLARVIGETMAHLRDHGHCYPDGMTEEQWADVLTRISGPLLVDLGRDIPDETPEQHRERWNTERAAQVDALRLAVDHFHDLWD